MKFNNISVSNSKFDITSNAGISGEARGVNIGEGAAATGTDNNVSVTDSDFQVNVTGVSRYAWGIYMKPSIGLGTLNVSPSTTFWVNDKGTLDDGYAIQSPDGSTTNW